MSRSNPTSNSPSPASRFFEWSGNNGTVKYYDRTDKVNRDVALPFTFLLLDNLSTIKGWHEPSESGIFSNEVRDTRAETLVVKAFKGGILAEGFYSSIRDRVIAQGGHFVSNLYIAYRGETTLDLGALQFKGAALRSWMEFQKENSGIYKSAVVITGFQDGKKGSVKFRTPVFKLKDVSDETNEQATALDKMLQAYLGEYFKRSRVAQVHQPDDEPPPDYDQTPNAQFNDDDSAPF